MPVPKPSAHRPRRDPWLPAQVLPHPSVDRDDAEIEDLDLAKMDDDPFIYFLTPTPSSCVDDENMDFDMDFDAGIEDSKHPPPVVRSVSPSSLGGLSRPPPRPPTPPRSPATPDLDFDLSATPDEHEEYDYMDQSWPPKRPNTMSLPRRLKDKFKGHLKPDADLPDTLSPPASPHFPRPSSRGRAVSRSGPNPIASSTGGSARAGRYRGTPSRLSPHAWREPSPDVWDIKEEPEEEMHGGMGDSSFFEEGAADAVERTTRAVDIPAAKPKKKVRFALPAMEESRGRY